MAFLDFNDNAWQGEIGDISRILVGEQARYTYPSADASETIDGTRVASVGNVDGLYPQQLALNPGSDLGAQISFIENPALSGALSAAPGEPGTPELLGTIYLPLAGEGTAPYIRNIMQSRGSSGNDATIVYSAQRAGTYTNNSYQDVSGSSMNIDVSPSGGSGYDTVMQARIGFRDKADPDGSAISLTGTTGTITINGTDLNGDAISEVITVTASDIAFSSGESEAFVFSTSYFQSITSPVVASGFSGGQILFQTRQPGRQVSFTSYDLAMSSYLSLEMDKGNVPFTYRGCYATAGRIEVRERDELLQLSIEMSGRSSHPYENLAGTKVPDVTDANKDTVATTDYRTDISGLDIDLISENLMVGARTFVSIGDIKLPVINATLDFGLAVERSPVLTGDINIAGAPYRRRRRPLLTGEIHFSKMSNLSLSALNNVREEYIKINFSNRSRGGFPYEHEITFRKGQFQEAGDPTVDADIIRQSFSLLALPSSQGMSDDLTWRASYPIFTGSHELRNY